MNQCLCILRVPTLCSSRGKTLLSEIIVLHSCVFRCTTSLRLRAFGYLQIHSYSITAPATTTANPPATDQSGSSKGAAAADLGEAVLAGLEVAVLLVELVLEVEAILRQRNISSCISKVDRDG